MFVVNRNNARLLFFIAVECSDLSKTNSTVFGGYSTHLCYFR